LSKVYLVTGGAGFIGSHLVERLLSDGCAVRVFDNFMTGKRKNLASFLPDIELVEGDVRDLAFLGQAMRNVEVVFHQAAVPSVPRSVKDPLTTNSVNVEGTLNVLIASRDAGVRRVVYASSSSTYGNSPSLPKREDMAPEPRSPYAVSKLAGENYCRAFHTVYGMETVSLRYFNVYGPRQDPESEYAAAIPRFITALFQGRSPTIFGDGEQSRDFTFIGNVVDANLLAAKTDRGVGEVFNIACGERLTLNQLVATLSEITQIAVHPTHAPARLGDVLHSFADISKAREMLGYAPRARAHEGLRETVDWYRHAR